MGFTDNVEFIKEGDPVSPGTANKTSVQLDQNVRYLAQLLEAANIGSTVYARKQTVAQELLVGQPVYLNTAAGRFEAAYATTASDTATGYLTIAEQSQVWGIVAVKHNATLADILLFGYAPINIVAAVGSDVNLDGTVPAGLWYLSAASTGQLTRQQPPVTIPVLRTNGVGGVYVNPSFVDFLENHRHYAFELEMTPAGVVSAPAEGSVHIISAPNVALPGWLPASHGSFGGKAPTGAKFGYNLAANTALKRAFPPVPLQSVVVEMQRPSIYDVSEHPYRYGMTLPSELVVVDRNGIWWMSDCYDEVPWPTDLTTGAPAPTFDDCDPQGKAYSMKLYFTRVGFATDTTTVSSLRSKDSRLVVKCAGSATPGATGDLEIDLDLSFLNGQTDMPGYSVIKAFNATTNTFDFGPVVEGIYATSANVLLSGVHVTDAQDREIYQGPVGIGFISQASRELQSQLVRLDGAVEENYPVLYLGLPNDTSTSYVVQFEVPGDAPANSQLQLRLRLLGRSAGTLPQLAVSYYKTGRPVAGLATPIAVTQSYTSLSITTVATVGANQAVEAVSAALAVAPGDIVYVQVQRSPGTSGDAYTGEVGVMQQLGVLTST